MSALPRLHVISDDARLADARFVADAAAVLAAGGADVALHLRGRSTTAARLYELAHALLPAAHASGARLLVNDRVDVALVARAHGVQLREDSLDARTARALLGSDALIGVSRHADTVGEEAAGADFVVFGAVFETTSHPDRPAAGLEALRTAAAGLARRASAGTRGLIAIGGITPARVADVIAAGASGVAVRSGVWSEGAAAVEAYVRALNQAAEHES